jgi:ubiquinone/menaquinone biosynthesis C-methylase UbiE
MNFKQNVVAQFRQPHGRLGYLAGQIMAYRPSNQERNAWTLALLNLQPSDRVLELGFGPGVAIAQASKTVTQGVIMGIDHSDVMVCQASQRNAEGLSNGRVVLVLGSVAVLPELNGSFNKLFSVNVFQFWDDPVTVFRSLRQLMTPTGVLATTYMPRHRGATDQDTVEVGNRIAGCLKDTGFTRIQRELKPMKPVSVVCVLATNEETGSPPGAML